MGRMGELFWLAYWVFFMDGLLMDGLLNISWEIGEEDFEETLKWTEGSLWQECLSEV